MSLVEVVASIVILTLLLTSFLGLLLSATKSTKQAREVIDYTFIAQTEMETVHQMAQVILKSDEPTILSEIEKLDYVKIAEEGSKRIYEKTTDNAFVRMTLSDYEENNVLNETLSRLKIEVMPLESPRGGAQFESIIEWGGKL